VYYAHTPYALKNILESARELKPRRLLTVFGCGGDRDRKKRPLMGKIVQELSDWFAITSDNPRTEDPMEIIEDIKTGLNQNEGNYQVLPDRREAIFQAVAECRKGDILVIAGKGHEDYQILGVNKIHFDDREVAGIALAEKKFIDSSYSG
jgi:UDP-N-acetylmuramoyl-L-alanyl-D-glutamate--2,6-diaminopimelate ligase